VRILIAAPVPRSREGGAAGVVYNLAEELERLGHSVDSWFLEDVAGGLQLPGRFATVNFAVKVAARIVREKRKYSVVNIHAPCGFAYGFLHKVLRLRGTPPYVMTMHGLEERRTYVMSREAKKGRAWYFRFRNRLWHRFYHRPAYRLSIQTADRAIVLNREAWSCLQLKYKRDAQDVWYVPNGVEKRFFLERRYSGQELPRLLYVGTWLDHKGVFYLRDAFQSLAQKWPGLRLTVAGCMGAADRVKDFFDPVVRGQIDVIPFVSAADMPEVYARHDIFVFPSLVEGMPLVLLEAMATGMPVVTTETCGMADIVQDDVNGLLVPPADSEALVRALSRLLESAGERARLGQAAQQAMKHHTWERAAGRVESVLLLALRQNGKR